MLKDKEEKTYEFNLISNQCRFGYGFRTKEGSKQYFAFHGIPRGNSDYFTNVQISEDEYLEIKKPWKEGSYSSQEAAPFRRKYVEWHLVLLKGDDRLL